MRTSGHTGSCARSRASSLESVPLRDRRSSSASRGVTRDGRRQHKSDTNARNLPLNMNEPHELSSRAQATSSETVGNAGHGSIGLPRPCRRETLRRPLGLSRGVHGVDQRLGQGRAEGAAVTTRPVAARRVVTILATSKAPRMSSARRSHESWAVRCRVRLTRVAAILERSQIRRR